IPRRSIMPNPQISSGRRPIRHDKKPRGLRAEIEYAMPHSRWDLYTTSGFDSVTHPFEFETQLATQHIEKLPCAAVIMLHVTDARNHQSFFYTECVVIH